MPVDKVFSLQAAEIRKIYSILYKHYGPQGWWPLRTRRILAGASVAASFGFNSGGYHPGMPYKPDINEIFEIAAGAVLTQNTNWNNAAAALDSLITADMLTPDAVIDADPDFLAELIKSSGYYNQKALKLKALAELLKSLGRRTPYRDELLSVWGIGPETADSILLYGYGVPVFVIDLYTRRILSRWMGEYAIDNARYEQLREAFEQALPADPYIMQEYHAMLVIHAKRHCSKTPDCLGCPFSGGCPELFFERKLPLKSRVRGNLE